MTNYSYDEKKEIIQKCMDKNGQVNKALFDALNIDIKDKNWNKFITDNNIVIDITDIYSMTSRLKDRSCEIAAYLMANNGDERIRNVVMQAYMPLATKMATYMKNIFLYKNNDYEIEDLEIEISIILADELSRPHFNANNNTSFSSYLTKIIIREVCKMVNKNSNLSLSERDIKYSYHLDKWLSKGNTLSTDDDYRRCSEEIGASIKAIKRVEAFNYNKSNSVSMDDEFAFIEQYIIDDVDFSMDDRIAQKEDSSLLKKAFDTLTDIEKFIIEKKYGYNTESEEEMTLSDILPLVQEMFNKNLKYGTLKNIHKNALAKLRDILGDKVSLVFAA